MSKRTDNHRRIPARQSIVPTVDLLAAPDNRTLVAALERAVVTFRRGIFSSDPALRRAFHEVDRWICDCAANAACSFDAVCDRLQLDGDYLRDGLRRMKERAYATHVERERVRRKNAGFGGNS